MTEPGERVPGRRWWRRAVERVATTRVCPACNVAGPARLFPDELCATCQAQAAWAAVGEDRLVIDRASIDAAVARRQGEAAGERWWRRGLVWLPPAITLACGALAVVALIDLWSARAIGPLGALLEDLRGAAQSTTLRGLAGLALGVVALWRLRRTRHFRRLAIVACHAIAVIGGTVALAAGGFRCAALGGAPGAYVAMPAREPLGVASHIERVLDATVVILAPDGDGDAQNLAIGTGAVIAGDPSRAWIVTCSHVAMPYVAVGTWRDPRSAHPVWVQLSDGREGRGTVRWTAPPPLDVALVELPIADPPEPVAIAADSSELQAAAQVTFVPNPYRAGWKVLHGKLLARETHRTPAGTYDLLFSDLPVTFGDSGSGLYDARGRLVGLNTWTRIGEERATGISLPSETMRVLVDAIARGTLDNLDPARRE